MFPIGGMAGGLLRGMGLAGRAGSFIGRHSGKIGMGMFGAGIIGGTARDDRGLFRSVGGGLWGGFKGGIVGGAIGGGIGAAAGRFGGRFGRLGTLGAGLAGAMIGGNILGGFGAFKGGLGSNRPINRIRGLHQ